MSAPYERSLAASPERVFDAWLDPVRARAFLFATPSGEMVRAELDPRVGGSFLFVDRRPDGDAEHHGRFVEIDRPRRLVFLFRGPGTTEEDWSRVAIEIAPAPEGCRLVLTHEIPPRWADYADPVRSGWTMILEGLARTMERETMVDFTRPAPDTLRLERLLDAPVETVWRYLTESELRKSWFAEGALEPRVGGTVELVFDHDNLSDNDVPYPDAYAKWQGARGEERVVEIDPPHLLAFTWDGGKEGVARFELFAEGQRTRLVLTHSGITGPAPMANFGGGWTSHLDVLQARLAGSGMPDFWTLHARSEAAVKAALERLPKSE